MCVWCQGRQLTSPTELNAGRASSLTPAPAPAPARIKCSINTARSQWGSQGLPVKRWGSFPGSGQLLWKLLWDPGGGRCGRALTPLSRGQVHPAGPNGQAGPGLSARTGRPEDCSRCKCREAPGSAGGTLQPHPPSLRRQGPCTQLRALAAASPQCIYWTFAAASQPGSHTDCLLSRMRLRARKVPPTAEPLRRGLPRQAALEPEPPAALLHKSTTAISSWRGPTMRWKLCHGSYKNWLGSAIKTPRFKSQLHPQFQLPAPVHPGRQQARALVWGSLAPTPMRDSDCVSWLLALAWFKCCRHLGSKWDHPSYYCLSVYTSIFQTNQITI